MLRSGQVAQNARIIVSGSFAAVTMLNALLLPLFEFLLPPGPLSHHGAEGERVDDAPSHRANPLRVGVGRDGDVRVPQLARDVQEPAAVLLQQQRGIRMPQAMRCEVSW